MLSERQQTILDAVIRDYVESAEAVASDHLVRKFGWDFSPATVRNELMALDEAGYLTQPHTSAGRMPTDKGYRYFINRLMLRREAILEKRIFDDIGELTEPVEFVKQTSRVIAELTHGFVFAGFPDSGLFYKSGIAQVIQEPEFLDAVAVHEFSSFLDKIEDEFLRFDFSDLGEPKAFVGTENPIRKARGYGMIISVYQTPFKKESVIAVVGPKRMNYEKNLSLLHHLRSVLMR